MIFPQLTKREKRLLWTTGGIIFVAIGYVYLIEPGWNFVNRLNNELVAKKIEVLKSRRIISQKDKIDTLYQKLVREMEIKGSLEEEMAVTLREIELLSKKSNLELIDIKPKLIKDMDFYKRLVIVIEAEGKIDQITKFIYELASSTQLLKVSSLRLTAKSGTNGVLISQLVISRILGE